MNPIYKFTLSANGGAPRAAFPVYRDDLSKDFEQQDNQEFYRAKLSGKLTFVREDYAFIVSKSFDTKFVLTIYISYDGGQTWAQYWAGTFWKTNCTFNDNDQNVTLTPDVADRYTDILAGMDKEFNLIDLTPQIVPVSLDKRPMIQMYVPGQSVIACFLSGMYWEQECTPESDANKLTQHGNDKLNFAAVNTNRIVEVTQMGDPVIPDVYFGTPYSGDGTNVYTNGAYRFEHYYYGGSSGTSESFRIRRVSDGQLMWRVNFSNQPVKTYPIELTLTPESGSGATGNVKLYIHDVTVYGRLICDTTTISGNTTFTLPADDIVENNRNYKRVFAYNFPDSVVFFGTLTETPTQWGIYQPGKYYQQPPTSYYGEVFPISRNAWGRISLWFVFSALDSVVEQSARQEYTLRDAFPLASVISVLLHQIAPNITHQETIAYSQFFYGQNPLLGITQRIFITPKSNMISLGYDQPAQKAPITLKRVLDMLRDCFRCYWYIDEQNRFRIEHVSWFMNGGAYPGTPDYPKIGRDLTNEEVTRNGKYWAFGTSEYRFDKPEMAARYQFGWMDDVSQLFEGNPIDIVSQYVNPDNIEQIEIAQFTSDVDYILLNPNEVSKDGFVLLSAILSSGKYKLPYVNYYFDDTDHYLQNAYVAFIYLQQYYFYDMPARYFKYNGEQMTAQGIKKLKTQTLNFPAFEDPDPMELIKTNLGNGTIQKMSVNLSSRNANTTLKYDTE